MPNFKTMAQILKGNQGAYVADLFEDYKGIGFGNDSLIDLQVGLIGDGMKEADAQRVIDLVMRMDQVAAVEKDKNFGVLKLELKDENLPALTSAEGMFLLMYANDVWGAKGKPSDPVAQPTPDPAVAAAAAAVAKTAKTAGPAPAPAAGVAAPTPPTRVVRLGAAAVVAPSVARDDGHSDDDEDEDEEDDGRMTVVGKKGKRGKDSDIPVEIRVRKMELENEAREQMLDERRARLNEAPLEAELAAGSARYGSRNSMSALRTRKQKLVGDKAPIPSVGIVDSISREGRELISGRLWTRMRNEIEGAMGEPEVIASVRRDMLACPLDRPREYTGAFCALVLDFLDWKKSGLDRRDPDEFSRRFFDPDHVS